VLFDVFRRVDRRDAAGHKIPGAVDDLLLGQIDGLSGLLLDQGFKNGHGCEHAARTQVRIRAFLSELQRREGTRE